MTSRISSSTDDLREDLLPEELQPSAASQTGSGDSCAAPDPAGSAYPVGKGGRRLSSGNSCSGAGFLTRQRELVKRRLWPVALTFVSYLLYHVVGTATFLNIAAEDAVQRHLSAAEKTAQLKEIVSSLLGYNSFGWILLTLPLAAILAVEGFSWLDDRRKVDFYESLPTPRGQRFFDICAGSFLYYLFSYVLTLEIGLAIAGAAGALSHSLLLEIFHYSIRCIAFFIAVYALGVLCVMLTGNVIVAWLAFMVLLSYETAFKMILRGYCGEFFATWNEQPDGLLLDSIFSPLWHFRQGGRTGFEGPARLLALAVLFFLLAWICYRLRKNELAETAVVFSPVRTVVRIAMAVIVGLLVGLLFHELINTRSQLIPILWAVLFAALAACIMQIIYEYDFRALLHRPLEIAAAIVITVAIYLAFVFDVTGYDRFLPDPDKVADASLAYLNYDLLCNEEGNTVSPDTFANSYMHLENVKDVIALAQYGQEYTRLRHTYGSYDDSEAYLPPDAETAAEPAAAGSAAEDAFEAVPVDEAAADPYGTHTYEYRFLVTYRMKNGKVITRRFYLPSSIDPSMMDAVIGTPAWREGAFGLYHDNAIRAVAGDFSLDYTNGENYNTLRLTPETYETFRNAYFLDLEQFSYSFAHANRPVGKIYISYDQLHAALPIPDNSDLENMYVSYPVYPSFRNTIAFLQENGVWLDPLDYEALLRMSGDAYTTLSKKERERFDSIDFSVFDGMFAN